MAQVLNVYKPLGLTPLQLIERLRKKYPEYERAKISYAGRLDPMAEGVMILLLNEANKIRQEYLDLRKTYEFEVVYGMETDTHDLLGKVITSPGELSRANMEGWVEKLPGQFMGKRMQAYPAFSSRTFKGKPLWWWAREGKLEEIVIPKREVEIFNMQWFSSTTITGAKLWSRVMDNIPRVEGDFRQDEVIESWRSFLTDKNNFKFFKAKFGVECSSGTYVRSIASGMGRQLGGGALALSIKRVRVGEFCLGDSIII